MLTKDNNLKVMKFFFMHPYRSFHIRELSRLTGLSTTGIIKIVQKLKKNKLLVSKKEKVVENITPDFNGDFLLNKRLYNIYSLYNSELIAFLKKFYEQPKAIVLFGSYSKGLDNEKSDIDMAIITDDKKIPNLEKFEKLLNRPINIHLINLEKTTKEFKNSLTNGIVLEGFVELIK